MFDMNGFFAHESLPGLWSKNFYAPLFIGISFLAMGSYIRVYDDSEEASKLFGFGLLCLVLGSCCVVLSICWFMFEYKDRQELLNRRARANYVNRTFFLNMRNPSSQSSVYTSYLTGRRRSARWYEIRRLDAQRPPSYQEALCSGLNQPPSFIRLPAGYSNNFCSAANHTNCYTNSYTNHGFIDEANPPSLLKYLNDKGRTDKVDSQANLNELSVLNLPNVILPSYELPSYEEAIRMDESNENTKL